MAWVSKAERHTKEFAALQAAQANWAVLNAIEPGEWIVRHHKNKPYWTCERGTPLTAATLRVTAPVSAKFLSAYADSWVA